MENTKMIIDLSKPVGHPEREQILEMTPEEIAERDAQRLEFEAAEAERQAEEQRIADVKTSARAKLVSGEPLTAEEAALLVL